MTKECIHLRTYALSIFFEEDRRHRLPDKIFNEIAQILRTVLVDGPNDSLFVYGEIHGRSFIIECPVSFLALTQGVQSRLTIHLTAKPPRHELNEIPFGIGKRLIAWFHTRKT